MGLNYADIKEVFKRTYRMVRKDTIGKERREEFKEKILT